MSDFFRASTPRAIIPHKCGECLGVIEPGEIYESVAGHHDGEFWTAKRCSDCGNLYQDYTEGMDEDDYPPAGMLAEYLAEDDSDEGIECLKRFNEIAKRRGGEGVAT